jgi:hypothetical protein
MRHRVRDTGEEREMGVTFRTSGGRICQGDLVLFNGERYSVQWVGATLTSGDRPVLFIPRDGSEKVWASEDEIRKVAAE